MILRELQFEWLQCNAFYTAAWNPRPRLFIFFSSTSYYRYPTMNIDINGLYEFRKKLGEGYAPKWVITS